MNPPLPVAPGPARLRSSLRLVLAVFVLSLATSVTTVVSPTSATADPPGVERSSINTQQVSAQTKPVIYLTFDDGPDLVTTELLALLRTYDIKATFFMTGRNVLKFPDIAVHAALDGHVIANHTYSHEWLTRTDPEVHLERAQQAIEQITGTRPLCYRPPYGATNARVRAAGAKLGMTEWLWDLDTNDWRRSVTAEDVVRSLDTAATFEFSVGLKGTNVLMHDGGNDGARTVEAMTTWLSVNHDRYDFRLIENCGGQAEELTADAPAATIEVSTGRANLTQFQTETLFRAFVAQGFDLEAWNVWRENWQQRMADSGPNSEPQVLGYSIEDS